MLLRYRDAVLCWLEIMLLRMSKMSKVFLCFHAGTGSCAPVPVGK